MDRSSALIVVHAVIDNLNYVGWDAFFWSLTELAKRKSLWEFCKEKKTLGLHIIKYNIHSDFS